jgi:hypothetical protein
VLAAGRAVDQQNAGRRAGIVLSPLRVRDASACPTPFDGKLIIGIGKALSGPFRTWRFARILVPIPRDLGQAINLDLHRIKCRIIKTLAVPTFEFVFIELRGRHFLSDGCHGGSLDANKAAQPAGVVWGEQAPSSWVTLRS